MPYDLEDPRLTAYALGEIDDPKERTRIEAWLAESPEARELVEDVRRTAEWLSESLRSESQSLDGLDVDRRKTIESKLAAVSRQADPDRWSNHAPWYAYAVAASLLIGTFAMAFRASQLRTTMRSVPAPAFSARHLDALRSERVDQAPELAFRGVPSEPDANAFEARIRPGIPKTESGIGMADPHGFIEEPNAPRRPGLDRPGRLLSSEMAGAVDPPGSPPVAGRGGGDLSDSPGSRDLVPESPALRQAMSKPRTLEETFEEAALGLRPDVRPRAFGIPQDSPAPVAGAAGARTALELERTRVDPYAAGKLSDRSVPSMETSQAQSVSVAEPLRRQTAPTAQPPSSLAAGDLKDETQMGRRLDRAPRESVVEPETLPLASSASSLKDDHPRAAGIRELDDRGGGRNPLAKQGVRPVERGAEARGRIAGDTPAVAGVDTEALLNAPAPSVGSSEPTRVSTLAIDLEKPGQGMPVDLEPAREIPFHWTMQAPRTPLLISVDPSWFETLSREVLDEGHVPAPSTVQIDALLNAIRGDEDVDHDQLAEAPAEPSSPVSIVAEIAGCPWNPGHRLAVVVLIADRAVKGLSAEVEFNPSRVAAYRRIGDPERWSATEDASRRELAHPPIAAGHEVTTVFELVPSDAESMRKIAVRSKYVRLVQPEAPESFTVHVESRSASDDSARADDVLVIDQGATEEQASLDFRFTAAAAAFGLALRESDSSDLGRILLERALELAKSSLGDAPSARRLQLVEVIREVSARRARTK